MFSPIKCLPHYLIWLGTNTWTFVCGQRIVWGTNIGVGNKNCWSTRKWCVVSIFGLPTTHPTPPPTNFFVVALYTCGMLEAEGLFLIQILIKFSYKSVKLISSDGHEFIVKLVIVNPFHTSIIKLSSLQVLLPLFFTPTHILFPRQLFTI